MANYTKLTDLFTGIANSIRSKTGSTSEIIADNFPSEINNIVTVQEGTSDATASASNILTGKTAYVNGSKVTGTMANQGAQTSSLNCGSSYTIPAGYHNGSGKVTANSLASQTSATATAAQILTGQTAYVNGSKVTGSMADQGTKTQSLNCGDSYTIPAGYHNGKGKVTANSLSSQTSATASASDILSGKTAYVNGSKVTGTIPTKSSSDLSSSGATVTVPAGYYASQASKSVTTATQATPSIAVNSSGVITASATQSAGYVSAGVKSATKNLTTQAAQTITPGTSNKTISSGRYLTGTQTIKGDANLVASNIKSGVSIFGVKGTANTVGDVAKLTVSNGTSGAVLVCGPLGSQLCSTGQNHSKEIGHVGEKLFVIYKKQEQGFGSGGINSDGENYTINGVHIESYTITGTSVTVAFF